MPELPEVETIRRGLEQLVCGKIIKTVDVLVPNMVTPNVDIFSKILEGQMINNVRRRGKYLIFELDAYLLISHLRMEGKYLLFTDEVPQNKHFHVFFKLDTDTILVYQDVRKFGTFEVILKADEKAFFKQKKLGPEPTPEQFDLDGFINKLLCSSKMIKSHLLDQTLVSGLGNIYVDEVLWASYIHPEQLSRTLTIEQMKQIHYQIIRILKMAVEKRGATIRTYRNALGEDGIMQNYLNVYGKTGQCCLRCNTVINKIKVGGRGTHFCPKCQIKQ